MERNEILNNTFFQNGTFGSITTQSTFVHFTNPQPSWQGGSALGHFLLAMMAELELLACLRAEP